MSSFVGYKHALVGSSFCIISNFLTSRSLFNYDIKKLIMMQKTRTKNSPPTKLDVWKLDKVIVRKVYLGGKVVP